MAANVIDAGTPLIEQGHAPVFSLSLKVDAVLATMQPEPQRVLASKGSSSATREAKGKTVLSKVFNFERRAYHLKVDIDLNKNISVWIAERGSPIVEEEDLIQLLKHGGNGSAMDFSSLELQFEVVDKGFSKRSTLFHTFSHD